MEGLRLLIVEGNAVQAEEKAASLGTLSHSAYAVGNLEEAFEALTIERFDAILVSSEIAGPDEVERRLAEAGLSLGNLLSVVSITPDSDPADLKAVLKELKELKGRAEASQGQDQALFHAAEFEEQCAGEFDLMVEIVDLFLKERDGQIPEMAQALQTGDFKHLSHVAHTLKGSLGSLHAPIAWDRAQRLESAARNRDAMECEHALAALETDIAQLEPQLLAFREACLRRKSLLD